MTETEQLADVIALVLHAEMAPLLAKIAVLEARPVVAPESLDAVKAIAADLQTRLGTVEGRAAVPGKDGKDVDPVVMQAAIDSAVTKAVAAIPVPKDGAPGVSVDAADVSALVVAQVKQAVSELPVPKDGRSITVDDVAPFIVAEVQKSISAIPPSRDGVGLTGALLDRAGHLVLTLSDGVTKDVGLVIGKDGAPGVDGQSIPGKDGKDGADGRDGKDAAPGLDGKDGAPGLGFDDLDLVFDETRGYLLRFQRGTHLKEWAIPLPFDGGVWQVGRTYPKGAGVTVKGAWWIAQKDTAERPGDSRDWRLSVKGGRDGKDGKDGKDGE
jgi:hypothetical protein